MPSKWTSVGASLSALAFALPVIALFAASAHASPVNLVQNGDFSAGFTDWTQTGNTTLTYSGSFGPNSTSGAELGPTGTESLIQNIPTVAGAAYDFSFALQNDAGGSNDFTASLNSTPMLALTNAGSFDFQTYSFGFNADFATTTITFSFQQDPAYWQLSDVSVVATPVATPLPAALPLFGAGLGLIGLLLRRRRDRSPGVIGAV